MSTAYTSFLPKGKLYEAELLYNSIDNPILVLRAINEKSARRFLYKKYGDTHHFTILNFKKISSIDEVRKRAQYVDIRIEKYWDDKSTQKIKYVESYEVPKYIKI